MLSDALSYPQSGDGWRSVLIGGLLTFFSWLLLPAFLVWGYYVRVLRGAALEKENAPRFEDWGDLLIDGFKSFLIFLGYVFLPFLLVGVFLFSAVSVGGEDSGIVLFLLVGLVGTVFLLGMFYLFPVAVTAFALTDRLGAAFELRSIVESAFTGDYAIGVLLAVVLRVGVRMASGMLLYIVQIVLVFVLGFGVLGLSEANADPATGIGVIFAIIVGFLVYLGFVVVFTIVDFYAKVAMYHLLGRGCGPSLREELSIDRPILEGAPQVGPEPPER